MIRPLIQPLPHRAGGPIGQAIVLAGALAITAVLAVSTPASAEDSQRGSSVEQPGFETVAEEGRMQIRAYGPTVEARFTVEADNAEAASSAGFGTLADYIFGANESGTGIDMTAPVTTRPAGALTVTGTTARDDALTRPGPYTLAFTMPSRWSMDDLPAPKNEDVRLVEVPARTVAAWRTTGPLPDDETREAIDELVDFARKAGFTPAGSPIRAGYDGPDVPAAERRNEVMIPVTRDGG